MIKDEHRKFIVVGLQMPRRVSIKKKRVVNVDSSICNAKMINTFGDPSGTPVTPQCLIIGSDSGVFPGSEWPEGSSEWQGRIAMPGATEATFSFRASTGDRTPISIWVMQPSSQERGDSNFTRAMCGSCLLYTSPSPRDKRQSRMPSSA